jgi:hypothetical protein
MLNAQEHAFLTMLSTSITASIFKASNDELEADLISLQSDKLEGVENQVTIQQYG